LKTKLGVYIYIYIAWTKTCTLQTQIGISNSYQTSGINLGFVNLTHLMSLHLLHCRIMSWSLVTLCCWVDHG
jgi:hypothetical protein